LPHFIFNTGMGKQPDSAVSFRKIREKRRGHNMNIAKDYFRKERSISSGL